MTETIRSTTENGKLTIFFGGRIDSVNAPQVEEQINSIREGSTADTVVLDMEDLEYISSAGLRIILRLRKERPELTIINVSSEVYEIFSMTGFVEMMPIEKAYRKLSVEGCEIIGKGSNGEVYRLDADTIVKVYFNNDALPDIQRERELARKAFVLGIPTAIPYDVAKVGDKFGSVFELLNAESLTKILDKDPGRLDEVVDIFVDLLKKIHATEVKPGDMPDMKKIALSWAKDVKEDLAADKWEKLVALIEAVPENNHMIHGDYHTKNVMVQNGEVLLIDMDTICYGDPVFEWASVFNAFVGFNEGKPIPDGPTFIGISYELSVEMWKRTLIKYFSTEDETFLKNVEDKAALIGYTRILRRTKRRLNLQDPVIAAAVEFYKKTIEELVDKVDTLTL